jgi:aerobic carbon-monoxide dehydrogenase large subunit
MTTLEEPRTAGIAQPAGERQVGARVPRREDRRLITGNGLYTDDINDGAYEAAFVRSPYAHARVLSIDVTEALAVPGLVAIYTHEDLPERVGAMLPLLIPHPCLSAPRTGYPLARDAVHHVGEPVVMVVATDRYAAEDAAERISVGYEPLPAVIGAENAAAAEHAAHEDVPDNVAARMVQEAGDAAAAIEAAPHTLDLRWDIARSCPSPLEGRAVHARWDAADQSMRVYTSSQLPVSVRAALASRLDLPLSKVEVIAPDVGGGFGTKLNHPKPEEVLLAWAARLLTHPVKWTEDRREHFISSSHEREQVHFVRVGFDDDGRILGLSVRFLHDTGAYTPYGIIVPIISATQLPGPYKLPDYRVEFTALYTNTVIVTPYRGAGRPQGVWCMERTMDRIAQYLGKDRTEVRRVNLVRPEDMPWDTGLIWQDGRPAIYDSGDFPASLRLIKDLIGWDDFPAVKAQAAEEGRKLGIGIGCYVEGTGLGPYEGGYVKVEPSGRVLVATGLSTQGQSHETILAQIAADELGVPIDRVQVTTGDSRLLGYAVGTFASRTAVTAGNAVALAAGKVRAKALRIAGKALGVDPGELGISGGVITARDRPGMTIDLGVVATLSNPLRYAFDEQAQAATQFTLPSSSDTPPLEAGEEPGLEAYGFYSPVGSVWANGMHAVVVETDPRTAEVKVLRYAVMHDCGNMVNPMVVEGQVHGGVAQGVAGALYERMAYDEDGQLQNASFMDFLMPFATEVPEHIEMDHLETPSPLNPLGVKGAGEAGVIPAVAAIIAAVEDAEGFPISQAPVSPDDIFRLRKGANR